jgi:hypothetical protein
MDRIAEHKSRCAALVAGFRMAKSQGIPIGLQKTTSNLFRRREQGVKHRLNVHSFNHVLRIDLDRMTADVEAYHGRWSMAATGLPLPLFLN